MHQFTLVHVRSLAISIRFMSFGSFSQSIRRLCAAVVHSFRRDQDMVDQWSLP